MRRPSGETIDAIAFMRSLSIARILSGDRLEA
jgi:hypothetical protein